MLVPAARGVILEELVLHLLSLVGYRIVVAGEEGTRGGHCGLEVRGRGEWHQIDALAAFDRTPAFMYPLRLMVEAKCYARTRPVGIEVARSAVGVLKDISENYFTYSSAGAPGDDVQAPRFNYHSAVFSTSGYTAGAQRYAIAHQVFLIQYQRIRLLEPIVDALLGLENAHFSRRWFPGTTAKNSKILRAEVRTMLNPDLAALVPNLRLLSDAGKSYVQENLIDPLLAIEGSYFGMLQGKWPMHLLSRSPLPPAMFADRDEVACRVYGQESDRWSFSPVNVAEGSANWFRLEFDIPEQILEFVQSARGNPVELANVKQQQFSVLDVAGRIGGVQRQVRLRLDEYWLASYLERIRGRG